MDALERLFGAVRRNVIGLDERIRTPCGEKRLLYADWCATGRLYRPIETYMAETVGPCVGNTHTGSNYTGGAMTAAYKSALALIKRHVGAGPLDAVLACGTGMTGAVNKLQRMMGLRLPEWAKGRVALREEERPLIFITHMEHHSNQISWLETIGEVVIVPPDRDGRVSPRHLEELLKEYPHRLCKIGAFTACSNVTGIETPIPQLARIMHAHGGIIVADYSASAPYTAIDMHPADPLAKLDAVLFSPHKFLGGPGTNGVLVFDSRLARSGIPDHPGGGTVQWTDPWGGRLYVADLEEREDGGTPGFLQTIRTALCIRLKEHMRPDRMAIRELMLLDVLWRRLEAVPNVRILEKRNRERKAIVSMTIGGLPHLLATRLLNDRFGIQARGGCSCAGSYGHYLFGIGPEASYKLSGQIKAGCSAWKPGWVRVSLHPVMTVEEADQIGCAVEAVARYGREWAGDYLWEPATGEYRHRDEAAGAVPDLIPGPELFQ
ncbi:aminotransferase class V-fold PLP-dependent enzyme [Gorillibacterium sp. sgz5001074]|uniref:aminotransferase class V-fold PLP-dependent enzyme n=1 Tax=Gorillibacterium sp. sgz5001074 TaxID=3446695 RepID=UPI003F6675ED